MSFDFNLSLVLAHSLLLDSKQQEPIGQAWVLNGGDPKAPDAGKSMGGAMRAYIKNADRFTETLNRQMMPTALAEQDVANRISPQQQALQSELYARYAPILNKVGQDISNSNAQNQSQSDLNILRGTGKDVAAAALEAQKQIDPEFYKNREAIGSGLNRLLGGMGDANTLSGGERAEVERSVNRGNLFTGNTSGGGINTVQNAMTFGNALNNRRNNFMSLFGGASGVNQGLKSGVDAFQVTTGKPSIPQFGGNQLTGAATNAGSSAIGTGNNLFNQGAGFQNNAMNINANRRDSLDRVNETMSAV